MELTAKKVLVTGAAGFIGSNLCEYLLKKANRVKGADSFITGKHENIATLKEFPGFTFMEGDLRNIDFCKEAVKDVDIVFHLAAVGSVPRSIEFPLITNDNNINGFLNVLVASKDAGIKRFIYASSSSVYGDSPYNPKREDVIGDPLSPYALTKRVNEQYAKTFSQLYGIETIGLRYFNVFGKRQDPQGAYAAVIPRFIKMFRERKSPVIFGDGLQSRDFTYVDNVLLANELAALTVNSKALNTVYNIACGESVTLNDLAVLLRDILKRYDPGVESVEVQYGPARKGDIKESVASIEKAETLLGYKPLVKMREGLTLTAESFFTGETGM
jgi:UDP-N-acetylglucosamine/UDP-N-acetylgalactosamine 4-epimerase